MNFNCRLKRVFTRNLILSVILLCFSAGGIIQTKESQAKEPELPEKLDNGLLLQKDSKANIVYIRPAVDWKKYDKIYFRTLKVTDEAKDATPENYRRSAGHLRESWVIPEKDIELMRKEYAQLMQQTLVKEGLRVVETIDSSTLIIVPAIVDIFLTAPIEKSRATSRSRGDTYTETSGSITIMATFADGGTNRVLAEVMDKKFAHKMWRRNTRVQNISDMRMIFRKWGRMLADSLKKVQSS